MGFPQNHTLHTVEFAGFVGSNFERNVTKFAPHKALKLIVRGKLTFDERVVLPRVGTPNSKSQTLQKDRNIYPLVQIRRIDG